jgi:integrase
LSHPSHLDGLALLDDHGHRAVAAGETEHPLVGLAILLHDIRLSYATIRFMKRQLPKEVQELLGHSGVSITLDNYSHVIPYRGGGDDIIMEKALS